MGHSSMATCVLMALVLPGLVYGRPATNDHRTYTKFYADDSRSILSMLESRVSKPEDFSEQKAISSLIVQGNLSIQAKSRQRRLSDQRRAELETLVTLSKINSKRSLERRGNRLVDPVRIGRRRRFTDQAPVELASIKAKHIWDPAYPLIS